MSNGHMSRGNENKKTSLKPVFRALKKRIIIIAPVLLLGSVTNAMGTNNTDVLVTTSVEIANLKRHADAVAFADLMAKTFHESEIAKPKNGGSFTQWVASISFLILTSLTFYAFRTHKVGKKYL